MRRHGTGRGLGHSRHSHRRQCGSSSCCLAATLLLLFWSAGLVAQNAEPVTEADIKAAYLYKFAGYVTWPDGALGDPAEPFRIGVMGNEALARRLGYMTAEREVLERPVVVKQVVAGESVEGLHMLFVTSDAIDELARVREAARSQSTLVVTETEGALQLGSVINFTIVDRRVRFEVSLEAADQSGLKLSSQLLTVAERVERRTS